jgi:WNK lysine deficient protein kinase
MVKELDITDWDPSEIASMIEAEISMLFPERTNTYKNDENDEGPHQYHHYPSVSSCSSSQESLSGAVNRADDVSNGYRWHHGTSSFSRHQLRCGCPISLMP